MEISVAKEIMGSNFVGLDELKSISSDFPMDLSVNIPEIQFSSSQLKDVCNTHILILCVEKFHDGKDITIRNIINYIKNKKTNPCFYNQDWYLKEKFIDISLQLKWCLVSKNLIDNTRGVDPSIVNKNYNLFKAVELVYIFFIFYFYTNGEKLWNNDYVWCSDEDDKGDQIYIGRYTDASGLNSDGLEIHRHLKIKNNYGVV